MTKEEAIEILKQPDRIGCNLIKANDEESTKYNQKSIEALNMAIKALEQEPKTDTLDKIRAEIEGVIQEEIVVDQSGGEYERIVSKLDPDDVLQIIDKYKVESTRLKGVKP